jgi:hypothetical protein
MSHLQISFGHARALPVDQLLAMIPSLPRAALNRLVERAIDHMDEHDGNPDVELNGDELDGSPAEDDFYPHTVRWGEAGCPIADPGG